MSRATAYIAMGSNLGDRERALGEARDRLAALPALTLERVTASIETAPLGGLDQPAYLNAMARVSWDGPPAAPRAACLDIEAAVGRRPRGRWASRELDLDLVRFGSMLCDHPGLTLPHPGLRDRAFWAAQLAELERHG